MYDFSANILGVTGGIAGFLILGLWLTRRRGKTPTVRNNDALGSVGEFIACSEPCPWCRSPNLTLDVDPSEKYHVACDGCAIWGPAGDDPASAVSKWDKRA